VEELVVEVALSLVAAVGADLAELWLD